MSVYTKLHVIQTKVHSVAKNGVNNFQKYSYVTLNDILDAVRPHLAELGLVVFQSTDSSDADVQFLDEKTYQSKARVQMTTTLVDMEDNSQISVGSVGFSTDKNGDKAAFKAETGARKYGLLKLFALDTAEAEPEDDSEPKARPAASSGRIGGGLKAKTF
jgi:hypothetical protein